jgi:hypothetical protein
MRTFIERKQYQTVPDMVIDAKLRAQGPLRQAFPELAALEAPPIVFAEVIRVADVAEVIRKLSDNGIDTVSGLLERTVDETRDEFGFTEDELRVMMSALVLLWWRSYHQKLRAEAVKSRYDPACHSCGDWGRIVVFKVNGTYATLPAMMARHDGESLFMIAGQPDVEVFRMACSCKFGQDLCKRNVPIL